MEATKTKGKQEGIGTHSGAAGPIAVGQVKTFSVVSPREMVIVLCTYHELNYLRINQ